MKQELSLPFTHGYVLCAANTKGVFSIALFSVCSVNLVFLRFPCTGALLHGECQWQSIHFPTEVDLHYVRISGQSWSMCGTFSDTDGECRQLYLTLVAACVSRAQSGATLGMKWDPLFMHRKLYCFPSSTLGVDVCGHICTCASSI